MNFYKSPSKKENPGAGVKKEVRRHSKIPAKISHPNRNPLSTLSENVPLPQNAVRISTASDIKKEYGEKKIIRSKSTSGVVTGVSNFEKVKAANAKPKVAVTQIASELPVRKNLFQVLPPKIPARKLTLEEKLIKRTGKKKSPLFSISIQDLFANDCLYNGEYFSENYKYIVATENELVYNKMVLIKHIDYKCRMRAVNLLFRLQHSLNSSQSTLFPAVRMFDNFLIKVKISSKEYELLGITCFWIASKFQNCQTILAPKLVTASGAKYSKYEIIAMEKVILKSLKFKLNLPEQSAFLYYFLKYAQLETDSKVLLGAMFLLELFTYLIEFSSSSSLRLVAAALYLTLTQYNMNCDRLLQYIHSHVTGEIIFNRLVKKLGFSVKELLKAKFVSNELIAKYSKDDKLNVAQYFTIH